MDMLPAEIRTACLSDSEAIGRLCGQLGYPQAIPTVNGRLAEILGKDDQVIYVAVTAGSNEICGWVHALRICYLESEPFAEIGGLVVDAGQRRQGAGRALMQAAEAWAVTQGLKSVRLRSNILREGAHRFYQSIGYVIEKSQYTFVKDLG